MLVLKIIIFFAILFATIAVYVISRNILNPLTLFVNHLNVMATGDFSTEAPEKFTKRKDEMGENGTINIMFRRVKINCHIIFCASCNP